MPNSVQPFPCLDNTLMFTSDFNIVWQKNVIGFFKNLIIVVVSVKHSFNPCKYTRQGKGQTNKLFNSTSHMQVVAEMQKFNFLDSPHWTVTSLLWVQLVMLRDGQEAQRLRHLSEVYPQLKFCSQMGWDLLPGLQNKTVYVASSSWKDKTTQGHF